MKLVESSEEFNVALEKVPQPNMLLNNQVYMRGAIFTNTDRFSTRAIYETSHQIDELVRQAFAGYETGGIQKAPPVDTEATERTGAHTIDWNKSAKDYCGIIYAAHEGELLADVQLYVRKTKMDTFPFVFEVRLAIGEYLEATRNVVTGMWPLIQAFDFASPDVPERTEEHGLGAILLGEEGNIVATGLPVMKKIGLDLPDKPCCLMECSYVL